MESMLHLIIMQGKRFFESLGPAIKCASERAETGIEVCVSLPFHKSAFTMLKQAGFFTGKTYFGCQRYSFRK